MSEWKAKRFWSNASVDETADGFGVRLDHRALRTPAKSELRLPTRAMAQAVADEWMAQEDEVKPLSMPVTRAANAAIDKVAEQFDEVAEMLAAYGDSDLLCYRADSPVELVARQAEAWDPLLDWADKTFKARLLPRTGLIHVPQEATSLSRLSAQVHKQTAFQLAAFHDLVSLSGSLVIGLAAIHDVAPVETLWRLSRIDEDWQEEQWGEDDEATQLANSKRASFLNANHFFNLTRSA